MQAFKIAALCMGGVLIPSACATVPLTTADGSVAETKTSHASVGFRTNEPAPVIHIVAGEVRVHHRVPSNARLRSTVLEGLDAGNQHLRYEWNSDGRYRVEVSGRYRHSVNGAVLDIGRGQLVSALTYVVQSGSLR